MPKGKPIPNELKEAIYNSYTLGESSRDISDRTGLAVVTVRRVIREQRKTFEKARAEMSRSGKIVKKDGKGGKLMALSPEGFEFTHVTPDGRSHKKKVEGYMHRIAERQYDAWCQALDDEVTFMNMVERKEPAVEEPVVEEPVVEEPVIEEQVAVEPEPEEAPEIEQEPQVDAEQVDEVAVPSGHVYIIWAKCEKPKFYGVFTSMDSALKRLDELNAVALFLDKREVFEVEEVELIA